MVELMVDATMEERPASSGLDWDKLFKMAEDCELDEDIRGPIETAIGNLESKEVHKLSAIRNLNELLQNEGEEAIERVLPAVQRALQEERSNLDLHCEAAIVFKGIIQNTKLCARFPGLTNTLLQNILENVTGQKDNLSAAAWLETLVEVAERVSLESVKQYIVPIVQQQAEPAQRVQRRIIASKLLHKLADILPANDVRKELGPCAQMLCQDSNANVRTSMAQRLPSITMALKNSSDAVSLLLPCFVQLYKDDDMSVKEACMNNIAQCIPHFTNDAKKNTIFPMVKKSAEHSLEKKDEVLMVIAKNFGEWCYALRDVLDQLDMCWVLNTYCKIGQVSLNKDDDSAQQSMLTMCRRMTAFNLPCMIQMFPKSFDRLLPFIEAFMTDSDDDVRLSLASSFHEILMMHPSKVELVQPFIELIRGGAPEVVAKLTFNMDKILPILYKCALSSTGSRKVTTVQLDRLLIGCNQVLRGTGSWRSHAALLENISVLKTCLPYTQLAETFIPVLQKEVLQARAIPCRVAAANTLLQFMREQPEKKKREETIEFLKKEVAGHPSCYRRMLYLDIVELVLKLFSRKFFIHYFLDRLLSLTSDKVSNIRLRTVRLLALVKRHLILPDDEAVLLSLERSVREVLATEKQTSTRQLLQAAACELSRTEARDKGDKEDAAREKEEDRLWDESKSKQQTPLKAVEVQSSKSPKAAPNLPRPPETRSSLWRTQRRAVAVVRPQPVVVVRSASPIPKLSDSNRPSRLPLSVVREKEALKKAATDSSLTRPSFRTNSSPARNTMSTSTPSLETTSSPNGYALRRSATTTSFGGSGTSTNTSYSLMTSRSSSNIRRPSYGLSRVSSHSTLEKKPGHLSLKVRNVEA
ncbi:hypothetical protein KIN20_032689 [Parelaphostrongylus tenuis]|uniref:Serine/threonine-protein phosphatase 4 regulatory subunit 4 n=1 Tax=Parelaphostrongylus tenuis TaxID=148309 RepID=A0AAD5R759_PARTN|nr:hypothetical protein KIN20_032689 [Parelaphostrongylus tenuis]